MSSLFGEQSMRLRRKTWTNTQQLADEIWTIFNGNVPITQSGPTTFNNDVTFNNTPGDFNNQSTVTFNSPVTHNGNVTYNGDNISNGPWTFNEPTTFNGTPTIPSDTQVKNPDGTTTPLSEFKPQNSGSGSGVLYGNIADGNGDTYTVTLLNPVGSTTEVTVKFPDLNDGDQLPAGLFIAPIVPVGSEYFAPVPAPSIYAARVLSGSGKNYQATLIRLDGFEGPTVSVTLFALNASARLEPGYVLFPVVRFGGQYVSQCAVWG